ncbi:hypothetical protein [Tautonia marina]|uniref:hypothetical protein n=1 Tax=Tautonia marina TaxID=2653855 RepID=UPI00126074DC|nr:hypothetical protein [Tautonia marina]
MTDRIRSQHGNVIAADFRPRVGEITVGIEFRSETLYCDDHIILTRATAFMDGEVIAVMHFAGNLQTGTIVTL